MLILNLKTTKHSEHTPLSAYHLNSDTDYSQCLYVTNILCDQKKEW